MKAYEANSIYFFLSTIPEKKPRNSANQPQRQIQEDQGILDTPLQNVLMWWETFFCIATSEGSYLKI